MNRRSFLTTMLKGATACMALPSALTYARAWKRTETLWVVNPEWENAPFELGYHFASGFGDTGVVRNLPTIRYVLGVNGVWKRVDQFITTANA